MVDVARAAEVSRTAVSLILNRVPNVRIAEATRQRVLRVAKELGYAPGPSLDEIEARSTSTVGLLINEISSAYPVDLIYGIQNWAETNGVQVVIQVTDGAADREAAALETFSRFGITDLVYASTFTVEVTPPPTLSSFHHVLLNCRRADRSGRAILPADRQGGELAVTHLIASGRRRIAMIAGDPWQLASRERRSGAHRALRKAGIEPDLTLERSADWSHAGAAAAMRDLLGSATPPDAVFCHNDIMARGALEAVHDAGQSVPGDVAVIGYDDREFAKDIGLSTITLPYADMAEQAMAELMGGAPLKDGVSTVPGTLVIRESTL